MSLAALLLGGGFVLGLVIGRWWAMIAAVAVVVWVGPTTLEVRNLAGVAGVITAIAIGAGVSIRKLVGAGLKRLSRAGG